MAQELAKFLTEMLGDLPEGHPDHRFLGGILETAEGYLDNKSNAIPYEHRPDFPKMQMDLSKIPFDVNATDQGCSTLVGFVGLLDLPPQLENQLIRYSANPSDAVWANPDIFKPFPLDTIRDLYRLAFYGPLGGLK